MSGCAATGAAFYGHYHWAVVMIVVGAVFDFFDGLTARALGETPLRIWTRPNGEALKIYAAFTAQHLPIKIA